MQSHRYKDEIFFYHEGGVDVGDVDAKASRLSIPTGCEVSEDMIRSELLDKVEPAKSATLARFIKALFAFYRDLHFAYLEINPIALLANNKIVPLDLVAKIDETAAFLCAQKWGELDWPSPFGRAAYAEEALIRDLDGKTGASLKLTILNDKGRVWTMVAGGGASVVYSDTVADYGWGKELANYGEYSGAPSTEETFTYAKTILSLMCRYKHPEGKFLIIGGGIANFTDVAATFTGLIKALQMFADQIKEHKIHIWCRRAGPNYLEGLKKLKVASDKLGLGVKVYGPETHITAVVPMALGLTSVLPEPDLTAGSAPPPKRELIKVKNTNGAKKTQKAPPKGERHTIVTATPETRAIVYGMQNRAVQGMLDFDFMCKRKTPSVCAMVFPFSGNHYVKFYWGTEEILLPVYTTTKEACQKHTDAITFINFASFRSVYETTMEAMQYPQMKTVAIIAEGVPEQQTRLLIKEAEMREIGMIGPATVGGIKPGCIRIGNTGGMLDNIVMSRLYRPGSVAYVSKSGGMSNELNNIICRNSNGVYEGVAIGGDRYPGSRFIDHLLRYQDAPGAKILLLLGEVGGQDEYDVIKAVKSGRIDKPVIAWCVGTCASCFATEVQFGHAGAQARGDTETAMAKNAAMKEAGIIVPDSFDKLPETISNLYTKMVEEGEIVEEPEGETPQVPVDYTWAKKLGMVRKPANFISSISDDRGEELKYCGVSISEVFSRSMGQGDDFDGAAPSHLNWVYTGLVEEGEIVEEPEGETPQVPMDYTWAKKLGMVRKPANFISSISDDRGEELTYCGVSISDVFSQDIGIGGVLSLLWFRRQLPAYCTKFVEMILMVTADHGPAVSGAHNTIVTARAGKDLVSSLCSGLLTIGPRFGGALDDAAKMFADAQGSGVAPKDWIEKMKKSNQLIMGIGHRIKSLANPDQRVEIIKGFAKKNFKATPVLDYALAVEQITTRKRANLILNVDGCIAVSFVDMIRSCGAFSKEECDDLMAFGTLNGLFVLGRSIGFIGHYLDQLRLKQPLYRHPWDDITYIQELAGQGPE
ncbi:Acly [Symbiodinium pilosum]|uniref:ATP citrate synthase n=1 Tax=Symbiodinium pilosum TaxID=2952 RepID=A0A812WH26_SYMPI|nr:Acly [Symbiodinium pilosum]